MSRSQRGVSQGGLAIGAFVLGMLGPLSGCDKGTPPAAQDSQTAAASQVEDPSSHVEAVAVAAPPEGPPIPVDIAAACRPWLAGGPADGFVQAYAVLIAAKHPAAVARYEAAVRAVQFTDGTDPVAELTAQMAVLHAARGLWDESIVAALDSLSRRGFDLYLPDVLAQAERDAGLAEGAIASALGVPRDLDPDKIRRGMLEFSATFVAATLLDRGFPEDLVVALLREDDAAVQAASRRLVVHLLAEDLRRQGIDPLPGLDKVADADGDLADLLRDLLENARRRVGPEDMEAQEALQRWVVATMGFNTDRATLQELQKLTKATWDGSLFWVAYAEAIAGSLPLATEDIDRLRSPEQWGEIPRERMHLAILEFLRLPNGLGAEWLAISDIDAVSRLCQRPLWDEVVIRPEEGIHAGAVLDELNRWHDVVERDLKSFAGAAP